MGEHEVELQLGAPQQGVAGMQRIQSQESVGHVAQPHMVPYHDYNKMRDNAEYWRA